MPIYKVKCYEGGRWVKNEPHPIEAADEQKAAEIVCDEPLSKAGKLGQLRAQVWLSSSPKAKKLFHLRRQASSQGSRPGRRSPPTPLP